MKNRCNKKCDKIAIKNKSKKCPFFIDFLKKQYFFKIK